MRDRTNALHHMEEARRLLWVIDQEYIENSEKERTLDQLALIALCHSILAVAADHIE